MIGKGTDMQDPEKNARPIRTRIRVGLAIAWVLLAGGCVHTPRTAPDSVLNRPATSPPTPPTVAGRDGVPTATVDLNRTVGENTTFHATPTERQKFQVHIDFGKVFEGQSNPDRALQEYQDALKVAESRGHRSELTAADEALAHRRIANVLDRSGRFRQAEPHYQQAQKLAPRDPKVWNDSGYSAYLQGRWEEAERSFRTAMKLAPGDARIRTNLGMTLGAAGKSQEALGLLSANDGEAVGHANLGYLLASTGQQERARQEYRAALAIRPDLQLATQALAQLDRQEKGIPAESRDSAIAQNTRPLPSARVDGDLVRTSAPPIVRIPIPPPPPLPPATGDSNRLSVPDQSRPLGATSGS